MIFLKGDLMNYKILFIIFFSYIICTKSQTQKVIFPYPVSEKNFISFSDTNLYCTYLNFNEEESSDFIFIISKEKNKVISLSGDDFITCKQNNFTLLNFRLPFLVFKSNVITYIHPVFAIKFLYLLNKVKFLPRISDAMRTTEEQHKYKKRGWSNVEDSPHLLGVAADLSYYTKYDRNIIQNSIQGLGIRYLEHGGKGNKHIHLQDETLWQMNKYSNIQSLSDTLNKMILQNNNILRPYCENLYTEKFSNGIEINFISDDLSLIKVEFITPLGIKNAEITTGVFENGEHKFYIRPDFLKNGVYCIRIYKNGIYMEQKSLVKLD